MLYILVFWMAAYVYDNTTETIPTFLWKLQYLKKSRTK